MFDAGSIVGHLKLDMSDYAHGVQEATLIGQLFPAAMVECFEHPLLAIMEMAKEAAHFIIESFEQIAGSFHNIGLSAERAGVNVEWLSKMGAVAQTAGVSIDQFVFGLKTLEKQAELASEGEKGAVTAFQRLGISAKEAGELMATPQALFDRVKESIDHMTDPSQRTAAALAVLGRQGFNLVPLLTKSSAEIESFGNKVEGLGGTVNEKEAEMGAAWGKMETLFSAAWTGIKKAIAEPILEMLVGQSGDLTEKLQELSNWLREGIASAFEVLVPLAKSLWSAFTGVADVLTSVLVPAFNSLKDTLSPALELLKLFLEVTADIMHAIGDVTRGVTDFVGLSDSSAPGLSRVGATIGRGGGDLHFQANIEGIDSSKATTEIADKLIPHIHKAEKERKQKLEHAAHNERVTRLLRGDR